jgi:hypothetical protein
MKLKNKTNLFQQVGGKNVRPWRYVEVEDNVKFDETKFMLVGEKKVEKKENKKGDY